MKKQYTEKQIFTQGYICCVANFSLMRDYPTYAIEMLNQLGNNITRSYLKECGVTAHDLKILIKNKII